jgi:PPM family protein phosphatase
MAGDTHPGLVRAHNEDAIVWDLSLGLAVLADGLGGHNAGEVAASMATASVMGNARQLLKAASAPGVSAKARALLTRLISSANDAIYEAACIHAAYAGMGTTLVAALFDDARLTIAHVGDSRCYRWRNGALALLTNDHTVASGLHTRRVLTRALGTEPHVEPDIAEHALAPGDIYLLCSDGLTDCVKHDEIASVISRHEANLQRCCTRLIEQANAAGGLDNISVVLVRALVAAPG